MAETSAAAAPETSSAPAPTEAAPVLPGGATASQLRTPDLPRRLFNGYEVAATNRLLERAAKTVDGLGSVVKQLRTQVEELTAARDELRRKLEGALDATGVHKAVGEVLVTAHKAAETLRADAERDADEIRRAAEGAQEQAAGIVSEAERRAAEIVAAAEAERERLLEQASADVVAKRTELEQRLGGLRHEIDSTRAMWSALLRETLALVEREPEASEEAPAQSAAGGTQMSAELRERLAAVTGPTHDGGAAEGERPE